LSVIDLGQIVTNPQAAVDATRFWLGNNAVLLGGCAVGALMACGSLSFGVARITERVRFAKAMKRRFGRLEEAGKVGLLRNPKLEFSGIPIGRIGRKYLCWTDQEPVLVTGGTRSGKGVGVIRPACLTYGGPLIAYDGGKGELFRDTSGYRKVFSHVLRLDLTDPSGVCFNFLDEIDPENPVAGADNLARAIPKPPNSDGHFEPAADRLIAAVVLHVLFGAVPEKRNMGEVVRLIAQGEIGMKEVITAKAHPVTLDRINILFGGDAFAANASDGLKYRQGVYNSAVVRLSAFEDPVVAKITSRSDFRMRDLFRLAPDKRPTSLYLTTPASEDDRLKPVMSMFLTMLLSSIMKEQPALEGQPRTLLVLDEFASLRMEILQTAITKIVGAGCTMLLGAQSLNALSQDPYGQRNQFRDNIRCHIAYASNDGITQRDISQGAGRFADDRLSVSTGRQPGRWAKSRTETEGEQDRSRVDAGELRELPDSEELIFIPGCRVIRASKIRDYKDEILKGRLNRPQAGARGLDGVYPDLPYPDRRSPWDAILRAPDGSTEAIGVIEEEIPEAEWTIARDLPRPRDMELPKRQPRKAKRKLIAAGDDA
jgi:type IV secretion system protein VirD4